MRYITRYVVFDHSLSRVHYYSVQQFIKFHFIEFYKMSISISEEDLPERLYFLNIYLINY